MEEESKIYSLVNLGQGKLLGKVYNDLAQPGVKKIGEAIGEILDISNTILLPIKLLNEKTKMIFKHNIDKYEKKLNNIADINIIPVANEIGVPILDRLTYVSNKEISDAFINLLAKASSTETVNLAHPGFIELIDRITPDEARIIDFIRNEKYIVYVTYNVYEKKGLNTFHVPDNAENLTGLEHKIKLNFPNNINVYLDNFVSLGILRHETSYYKSEDHLYNDVEYFYKDLLNKIKEEHPLDEYNLPEVKKGYYEVTKFGQLFLKACTDN